MKKHEAQEQLQKLQTEMDKLKDIINKPVDLFKTIKNYTDVCNELGIKEKIESDFETKKEYRYHQIQNIVKLFNGDSTKNYYYPYFQRTGSGLVFVGSIGGNIGYCFGRVACFKDGKTSDFVGKTFLYIYQDLDQ